MTDAINKCSATETAACCCVDVGTVLDNTDCSAQWQAEFATEAEAQAALQALTAKANEVASDPCEIQSTLTPSAHGITLDAHFTFCCQAETMIFQLALR